MMLHSLVHYYELTGHDTALDLASGMARQILGTSRYFNYKGEFFGHVHSAVWVASGLALLGKLTKDDRFIERAKGIYDYVLSISSSFGWVPEYAQWHPPYEEHCETCCIKDAIQCGLQLADCGYDEYWDVVNRFARNQLVENQIKDGSFLADKVLDRDDENGDERIVGGFSGGAEPNSISLVRFRSIAGCCVGTAPQAIAMVYERAVERNGDTVWVNMPIDCEAEDATVETGYPADGFIDVTMKTDGDLAVRTSDWMGPVSVIVNGQDAPLMQTGQAVKATGLKPGDKVRVGHLIRKEVRPETVRGVNFQVSWSGPDVVKLEPSGLPLRLYVRTERERKAVEALEAKRKAASGHEVRPTQQKG
jgi:DUF1680 family protein